MRVFIDKSPVNREFVVSFLISTDTGFLFKVTA